MQASLLAILGALLLSGCVRFHTDLEISADNTVSGSYIVAVADDAGTRLGSTNQELATELYTSSSLALGSAETKISGYRQDGLEGIRVEFTSVPLSRFAATNERFGIVRSGDRFILSGPVHMNTASSANLPLAPDSASPTDTDSATEPYSDYWDQVPAGAVMLTVTFPGPVLEGNGTVSGRSVTWDLRQHVGNVYAVGAVKSPFQIDYVLAYLALATIGVAALLYWVVGKWPNLLPPPGGRPRQSRPRPTQQAARKRTR